MTIPNVVSGIRILLVPLFLWLLLARDDAAAAGLLFLGIGATDWVDGYLARRLDQVSAIGKILDPTADRLAVGAAVIGGWIAGVLPWPVALAIVVREVIVTTVAAMLAIRLKTALEVRWVGKAGTFGLYGAIASFYVYAGWDHDAVLWLAWAAAIPALIFYYVSAVMYIGDARRLIAAGPPVSSGPSST